VPRVGLDRQINPDLFAYATVAQGEKFGGFNRAAESSISAQTPTDPEKVTAYEVGLKSKLADGKLTLNVAAFYNDFRDYIAALSNTTINGVLVTDAVLTNAGRATTYGIDLDMAARLTPTTDLTMSLELLRSRFDEFANPTGAPGTDYVGNELPYAPKVSFGTGITQTIPLSDGAQVALDATVQYIKEHFADAANTPALKVPNQTYVNIGMGYATPKHDWTFSFRVRNLFDKTYALIRTRIPPLGVDSAYYNAPRTLLFTARHDF
jgi:iron complex outermembrane receptor protein